jgi:arylsulfatase A-like enzyme
VGSIGTRAGRRVALAVVAALAGACGEAPPAPPPADRILVPVRRFVDAPAAGPLTVDLPVATILDDTRFALAAPRQELLIWPRPLPPHQGPRVVQLRPPLPKALADASRVLVLTSVKVGSDWAERPPHVLAPERVGGTPSVSFDVAVPAVAVETPVAVTAYAYRIDPDALALRRTGPVEIPVDASLEFAIGLLLARWGRDPVAFSVEACAGERCERLFEERFDPAEGEAWRDRRVDLGALAGETRELRFRAERLASSSPFSFPIWANPTLYAPEPRGERRNLILLSIDTLRADHLSAYGYARDTSPFLAEGFARGGAVFEQLVSAATITTPAHASIFTGLQPASHGTTDGMKAIAANIPTLPEWIRATGIDTAGVTEDGWLGIRAGFGRGFDVYEENKSPNIMSPVGQVDVTFAKAVEWLARNRDKRFFLFLHTFQVHSPYAPPERYRDLFPVPEPDTRASHERWRDDYDREIRYVDDELRGLVGRLDELGLGEHTVFVVTADHGEAFLEHGFVEHGARLNDEVVRVPLLLRGPGIPAGRRIAAPVAHVDLLPTILELFGIARPPWLEGRSLAGVLDGREPESALADRALFSETRTKLAMTAERRPVDFPVPAFMVRVGSRKLSRYPDGSGGFRYELYDVASDPGERRDLLPEDPGAATDLRPLLDGYEAASAAHRARVDAATRGGAAPAAAGVPLDPQQEQKLRALGYLE